MTMSSLSNFQSINAATDYLKIAFELDVKLSKPYARTKQPIKGKFIYNEYNEE